MMTTFHPNKRIQRTGEGAVGLSGPPSTAAKPVR